MKIISNMIEVHLFREKEEGIEFLLLKRSAGELYPSIWQMVTGKIKEGEKAYETALREIYEETGQRPLRLWTVPNVNSFYSDDNDSIVLIPVFAAMLNAGAEIILSKEHCEYKWTDAGEARGMLPWEGQRKSLKIIEDYFMNQKHFFDLLEIKFRK
ncbi:NUDIX hydrolase [Melioribacter sp. Ez-97]|uniref:NUDIX hydrolase n=1 Tax=Melioribacter sp. Ez-97 TaxID=3423434 RepID=UPI003EDA30B3